MTKQMTDRKQGNNSMFRIAFGGLCAALLWTPQIASAQLDCIVPTTESTSGSGLKLSSPALAPIRNAALAAEAIIKRNTRFMSGVRPIRVRTKIQYSNAAPWTATVFTGAYNEKAWVGKCQLSPFADRGGDLRDASITVVINEPRNALGYPVGDAALGVFEEPKPIGSTVGYPTFRETDGDVYFDTVVMTDTGSIPWIPVTIAEALDLEERRLAERLAEWQREKQKPGLSEADANKCVSNMKKINPARTEEACGGLRMALQEMQDQRSKHEAQTDVYYTAQSNDLRTYRASFSATQLQGPARPNGRRDSGIGRVDDPKGRMHVKVDPAYRRLDPNHIHLILVRPHTAMETDTLPGRFQWQRDFNAAIDYASLAKLLN